MKSRVSGFSRRALEAHTTLFGMWIAGYRPVSDFWFVLKAWGSVLTKLLGSFYADHVRFDLRYPYILASTDALIILFNCILFLFSVIYLPVSIIVHVKPW